MNVVVLTALGFQLDGHVFDAEIHGNARLNDLQQVWGGVDPIEHHVGGEHDQAWFYCPNMEIVDILHAGNRFNGRGDVRGTDRWRGRFQEYVEGFLEQRPRAMCDGAYDKKADQRVEDIPACQEDSAAAEDNP